MKLTELIWQLEDIRDSFGKEADDVEAVCFCYLSDETGEIVEIFEVKKSLFNDEVELVISEQN